jgi:hypothetical protein
MPNIGVFELLFALILYLVPLVLAVVLAARKGLEPLWLWVILAILFPWIILIVTLVVPARRAGSRA